MSGRHQTNREGNGKKVFKLGQVAHKNSESDSAVVHKLTVSCVSRASSLGFLIKTQGMRPTRSICKRIQILAIISNSTRDPNQDFGNRVGLAYKKPFLIRKLYIRILQ